MKKEKRRPRTEGCERERERENLFASGGSVVGLYGRKRERENFVKVSGRLVVAVA